MFILYLFKIPLIPPGNYSFFEFNSFKCPIFKRSFYTIVLYFGNIYACILSLLGISILPCTFQQSLLLIPVIGTIVNYYVIHFKRSILQCFLFYEICEISCMPSILLRPIQVFALNVRQGLNKTFLQLCTNSWRIDLCLF